MRPFTRRPDRRRFRVLVAAAAAVAMAIAGILLVGAAVGSDPSDNSRTIEQLRGIEQTRLDALVDADMPIVESLHAEDFQLVPPPGYPLTREDYLDAVAAGDLDYRAFEPVSDIDVRLYGNAAVLTYRSHIDIVAAGQGRLTHEAWHTYLYEKRQGSWQVVWEQATAVGGFPPPDAS